MGQHGNIFKEFADKMVTIEGMVPPNFDDKDADLWTFEESLQMIATKVLEEPDTFRKIMDHRVAICRNPGCGSVVTGIHDTAMEEALESVYLPDNKCVYCKASGSWVVIPVRILRELYEEISGDTKKWCYEVDL